MHPLSLHFVAQMSVERLLNCVLEGSAIALFAWGVLRLLGRRNSGTRFAVWFCALLAIAVAPFVEISSGPARVAQSASAAFTMPAAWSIYLFGAWALIALIGLVRVGVGLWHLRGIRNNSVRVDAASLDPTLQQTLAEFRSARKVELCTSVNLQVPTAVGFFQPVVILPVWALEELSPAELDAVVLHELAHLRRWDDWTNLAQKLLRALFFFHPAVWFVENRLSLEREMACDDMVLAQTSDPRAYAQCLVSLAEKNFLQRGLALAQAAVGRMRQTSLRVLQILDVRRPKSVGVWKPAPWVVAGFSVACLVGAEHAPRLVAFGDRAQDSNVATGYPVDSVSYAPTVVPAAYVDHGARHFSSISEPVGVKTPAQRANRSTASVSRAAYRQPHARPAFTQGSPTLARAKQPTPETLSNFVRVSETENVGRIAVMQQAVFVVIDQQPGNRAPILWQVSVWRFTVVPATASPIAAATSSKSI